MLRNYLKVALRNIKRNKLCTAINVTGLSVAMMGFIVVALYINYEMSYDKFHKEVEDIQILKMKYSKDMGGFYNNFLPAVFADAINAEIPGVQKATATLSGVGNLTVIGSGEQEFREQFYQFQNSFFEIFSFSAAYGDLSEALKDPNDLVVSKKTALKYFNRENVVGEKLMIKGRGELKISAVLEDFPTNSQFQPHLVLSLKNGNDVSALSNWGYNTFFIYVKTLPEADLASIESQIGELYGKNVEESPMYESAAKFIPFQDSYWEWSGSGASMNNRNKGLGADKNVIFICAILAIVLLIIALANYVNMAVSRAIQRAKEVGIRKVNGASPRQLIFQFLSESIIFSLMSLVVAVIALELLLPSISQVMGIHLSIVLLSPFQLLSLLGYALLCGLIAGIYPAFFLSRFQPTRILKTKMMGSAKSKLLFKFLLGFQFTLCAFLITATVIMNGQIRHYLHFDLGFTKDNVITVQLPGIEQGKMTAFIRELETMSEVSGFTFGPMPGGAAGFSGVWYGEEAIKYVANFETDESFIPTLNIKLMDGRNINPELSSDFQEGVLVNEQLVKRLKIDEPVGKIIQVQGYNETKLNKRIVGVIDDIHMQGPSMGTRPLYILPSKNLATPRQRLLVKLNDESTKGGISKLEAAYAKQFDKVMNYQFLTEAYAQNYHRVQRLTTIINGVATLIITISLFGLFAMVAFSISARMKEIGVRKVFGVKFFELQWTLSKVYLVVITIALIIAIPLAYLLMDQVLNIYQNRLTLTWEYGLYTLAGVYLLAAITVIGKGVSTLKMNPINILRND